MHVQMRGAYENISGVCAQCSMLLGSLQLIRNFSNLLSLGFSRQLNGISKGRRDRSKTRRNLPEQRHNFVHDHRLSTCPHS